MCVCVCACSEGRRAGLSSCALSIIYDLTLGKAEEGEVDSTERER